MKRDIVYLRHIADAIERIESYISVGRDVFLSTPHWQDAVIRQLEIIGEAAKRLSTEIRDQNPRVPWRRIAGLRDVLAHDYMGVLRGPYAGGTTSGTPKTRWGVSRLQSVALKGKEMRDKIA